MFLGGVLLHVGQDSSSLGVQCVTEHLKFLVPPHSMPVAFHSHCSNKNTAWGAVSLHWEPLPVKRESLESNQSSWSWACSLSSLKLSFLLYQSGIIILVVTGNISGNICEAAPSCIVWQGNWSARWAPGLRALGNQMLLELPRFLTHQPVDALRDRSYFTEKYLFYPGQPSYETPV